MAGEFRPRAATEADAARIADIYNQGIQDRVATFETELRTVEAVRNWFSAPYPIVVVERHGDVIAWANASQYRPRTCYSGICEFSVYVDRSARGSGAGNLAMRALIDAAARDGYTKLLSRVFVENIASRRLLQGLGFREVGVYHRHGQLDGIWRDVVIVERLLDQPQSLWASVPAGTSVQVIKASWHNLHASVLYPATVIDCDRVGWTAVRTEWTLGDFEIAGVQFERGGMLIEYFSPDHCFNIFQVFRRDGSPGGVYANVTAPSRLELDHHGGPVLYWEDHWLDVVKSPDGTVTMMDEDEFLASGVPASHPHLAAQIRAAATELLAEIESGRWDI